MLSVAPWEPSQTHSFPALPTNDIWKVHPPELEFKLIQTETQWLKAKAKLILSQTNWRQNVRKPQSEIYLTFKLQYKKKTIDEWKR